MRTDQQPSTYGTCTNCGFTGQVYEYGRNDYPEGKRPHLCYDCAEEWKKYYKKNRNEIQKRYAWREFFESWLALNPTFPEVVCFT